MQPRAITSLVSSLLRTLCLSAAVAAVVGATAPAEDLEVRRGEFAGHFLLTGELVAEDAELLVVPNANIWPVTVRWIEEDGTEVEAGDVLVEFDNSQLASNLEELERSALEAANQRASLRATVKGEEIEAELRYERSKAVRRRQIWTPRFRRLCCPSRSTRSAGWPTIGPNSISTRRRMRSESIMIRRCASREAGC